MKNSPAAFLKFFFSASILLAATLALTGCSQQPVKSHVADADSPAWASTEELKSTDFFKLPVGPKGLEPTPRLLSLNGKRVLIKGYIVQEEEPLAGLFILTSTPTFLTEVADGPADYLPPATVFVHLPPATAGKIVKYAQGLWSMIGALQIGGQEEPNGRVSHVRLMLDEPALIRAPDGQPPTFTEPGAQGHLHH